MPAHSGLTGASLHECKGIAAAAAGKVQIADGAGSASWTTFDYRAIPTGGLVQQVSAVVTSYSGTHTTAFPVDDTIPQNTEGVEIITLAITPKATTHILVIEAITNLQCHTANTHAGMGLFQDSTANALAATAQSLLEDWVHTWPLTHRMAAGTTSSTTFKIRAGTSGGASYSFNSRPAAAGRAFGGVASTSLVITEYKA